MTRRALVLSPTPGAPADHGNRNRVRQMTSFLVAEGYVADFVLYPMDGDFNAGIPSGLETMQADCGGLVCVVPPSVRLHRPPAGRHHTIDEWWDPAIDGQLAWLCARRPYDIMWINYAFLSRGFGHAPPGCLKVLDTHDVLAGRRELFERHGATPEFFQTTEQEEATGLRRADLVVAIKQSEAGHFSRLAECDVVTVPATLPHRSGLPRCGFSREVSALRVGFIGADNRVNRDNLVAFLRRLDAWRDVFLPDLSMIVAGGVCKHVAAEPGRVETLGHIADVATFYNAVDVVVAPLVFSTGLKVKIAEALAWGKPVVATTDAFDGFAAHDGFHELDGLDAVCRALMTLAADRPRLAALTRATQRSAAAMREAEASGFATLRTIFARRRRRIAFVSDIAFWRRSTLLEERLWQALAYIAQAVPVTLVALHDDRPPALPPRVDAVRVRADALVPDAIAGIRDGAIATVCALADGRRIAGLQGPIVTDHWPAAAAGHRVAVRSGREIQLDDGCTIAATPLRHLPPGLDWRTDPGAARSALLIGESGTDMRTVASAIWHRSCLRVTVFRTGGLATDPQALSVFAALEAPAAIVTLDVSPVTRDLAAALATWCGAASFDIAGDAYPLLLDGRMVRNIGEHIAAIARWLASDAKPPGSERAPDAGWSVIWRRIEGWRRDPVCAVA